MGCYEGCHPSCDACRPKFLFCPNCGKRLSLYVKECRSCGEPITEETKEIWRGRWAQGERWGMRSAHVVN